MQLLDLLDESSDNSPFPLPGSGQRRRENEMRVEGQHMVLDTFVYTEPEQWRNDLLSVAGHELRTPLAVLKLQTQHLQKRLARQGLDDEVAILAQMEAQIQKMERLNADLLNISKVQAGRLASVDERVDLNNLLPQ